MSKTIKQSQKNKTKTKNKNKNKTKNKNNKTKRRVSFAQKQKAIKQLKLAIKKHILNIINAHKKQHGGGKGPRVGVKDPKTGKIISETERLEQIGSSIYESIVSFFRELYEWITGKKNEREYKNGVKSSKEFLNSIGSKKAEKLHNINTNTSLPSNVQAIVNTARQSPEARRLSRLIKRLDLEADDADALAEAGTDAATSTFPSHQQRIKQYQQQLKQVEESKQELNEVLKKSQNLLSKKEMTEVVNNSKVEHVGAEGKKLSPEG